MKNTEYKNVNGIVYPIREEVDRTAKHDEGKLEIHLVPTQIIRDIAEVRMYGNKKYGDPLSYKRVEKIRYLDAQLRHLMAYRDYLVGDSESEFDEESGIEHYKHAACNMAFICEMEAREHVLNEEGEIQ